MEPPAAPPPAVAKSPSQDLPQDAQGQLSEVMASMITKVLTAKNAGDFDAVWLQVGQRLKGILQGQQQAPNAQPSTELTHDSMLLWLRARFPGIVDMHTQATALRTLLNTPDQAQIPGALKAWKEQKPNADKDAAMIGSEVSTQKEYLLRLCDSYNQQQLFVIQSENDAEALGQFALIPEIEAFAKSVTELPDSFGDVKNLSEDEIKTVGLAKIASNELDSSHIKQKIPTIKKKLEEFCVLCHQNMKLNKDQFLLFGPQLQASVPGRLLLTEDQVTTHYTPVWNERTATLFQILETMRTKWHTALLRLCMIHHKTTNCWNAHLLITKMKALTESLKLLLKEVDEVVKQQGLNLEVVKLKGQIEKLKEDFKKFNAEKNSVESVLDEFKEKKDAIAKDLQTRSQNFLVYAPDQKLTLQEQTNSLKTSIELQHGEYLKDISIQWQATAQVWNQISLHLCRLQVKVEQYELTFAARELIGTCATNLASLQKDVDACESEQSKDFKKDSLKSQLTNFMSQLESLALNQWLSEDLVKKCCTVSTEKFLVREIEHCIQSSSEEEKNAKLELTKTHSEHASLLAVQQFELQQKWTAMHQQGIALAEKLEKLRRAELNGGFPTGSKIMLGVQTVKDSIGEKPFNKIWTDRPKPPKPITPIVSRSESPAPKPPSSPAAPKEPKPPAESAIAASPAPAAASGDDAFQAAPPLAASESPLPPVPERAPPKAAPKNAEAGAGVQQDA